MENDKKIKINGKKLKVIRLNKGITQEDVAKAIGISKPMISYYENNTSKLDEEKVMKLCVLFNCTIRDITEEETINNKKEAENIDNTRNLEKLFQSILNLSEESREVIKEIAQRLEKLESEKGKTQIVGNIENSKEVKIIQK